MRVGRRASLSVLLLLAGCADAREDSSSPAIEPSRLLPARLRRLTAAEYDRAASDLLSMEVRPSLELPPDTTLLGFSANADAAVDALFTSRLADVAQRLAREAALSRLNELAPCTIETPECAARFVEGVGRRAFRRPLESDERARYLSVFEAGQAEGGYRSGVEWVLGALLQSPWFLYLTELGPSSGAELAREESPGIFELSPDEVAAQLAFVLTGGPPDAELLGAAERGELGATGRRRQASRLLRLYETRFQFRRFVSEWFGLEGRAPVKSAELYPDWAVLWSAMRQETASFVDAVMIQDNGSVRGLLAGEAPDASGQSRVGLLQQGSFLSRYAHVADTAPVLRGVFVLRRLLCRTLPSAAELGIEITFPELDADRTTRARYAAHSTDPRCAACHESIDGIGFSFESFDAIGRARATEAGQLIDTAGSVELEGGRLELRDSAELARALAEAPEVERCMQRQLLRFATGRSEAAAEQAMIELGGSLGRGREASILEVTLAMIESDLFVRRRRE